MKTFYNNLIPPTAGRRKGCKSLLRLLTLFVMCLVTGGTMAQAGTSNELYKEFTCNTTNGDFKETGQTTSTKDPITVEKEEAWVGQNIDYLQLAKDNSFTISATTGNTITKVVINAGPSGGIKDRTITGTGTAGVSGMDEKTSFEATSWNNTSVVINCNIGDKVRVKKITVYYTSTTPPPSYTVTASGPTESVYVNTDFNLTAAVSNGTATSYEWFKSTTETGTYNSIGTTTSASYTTKEATAGTYYYYCEATIDGNSTPVKSNVVTINIINVVTKKDVTLSATDLTLTEGETGKSTITSNPVIDNIAYTYTSGNESVAKVATDGTVTAVAEGTAVITVKYAGNNEYKEATTTFNVTVNKKAVVGGTSYTFKCNDGTNSFNVSTTTLENDDKSITATFSKIDGSGTTSIKFKSSTLTITSKTKKITKVVIVGGDGSSNYKKYTAEITSVNLSGSLGSSATKQPVKCSSWADNEVVISLGNNSNNTYVHTVTVYYEDGTPTAPVFTTQPEATTTLALGQELTLTAEASGTPTPTYQWYKNNTKSTEGAEVIEGATEKTYTATQEATGTTYYYCVATNSQGYATSDFAEVIVEKSELKLIGQDHTFAINDGTKKLDIVASYGGEVVENITLEYKSDNTSVAEIDVNTGIVTPKSVGKANITVTFAGNDKYKPAELTVVVTITQGAAKPIIKVTSDGEGKNIVENYTEENPYDKDELYVWLEKPADFADSKYEIHYSIDNSKLDKTWNGTPEHRTQTTYIYAQIYNKSTKKPEGEILEIPIRFNFTLLAAFGSKDNGRIIDPGFQRMLTTADDIKKPYIIATFGSKGDDQKNSDGGVWLGVSKDVTMGNSEISGYEYVARGNFDAKGEGDAQFAGNSMEEPLIEADAKYYMEESSDNGTFKIPVSGAYVMFEPKVGGTVNVILRQNGIIAKEKDPNWAVMRMRPIFVCDETGKVHEDVRAMISTNSQMNKEIFKFGNTAFKADNGANPQTVEQSEANLKLYQQMVYAAGHSDCTIEYSNNGMSASLKDASGNEVSDDALKTYWKGDAANEVTKNILHKYGKGWITLSKAYVRYSFDVEPGKTYFIMGHVTKVGACGYSFKRRVRSDEVWTEVMNKEERNISINENGTNLPAAVDKDTNTGITGVNVTLNRTFHKGVWTTLVLPFSVSPYTLAETFGEGTEVLHFGEVDGSTLNLVKHHHQMIVAGTPVLIRPKGEFSATDVINNVTFKNVSYNPGTPIKEMTGGGWKITGSYVQANMPANSYYVGYKADGTGNNVYLSTKVKTMNGTRAWFERYDTSAPAKLTSFSIDGVEDNTTTDIDSILTETEDRNADNATVYNLNGQVVSNNGTDGLANGIYIMNGKKIIIK